MRLHLVLNNFERAERQLKIECNPSVRYVHFCYKKRINLYKTGIAHFLNGGTVELLLSPSPEMLVRKVGFLILGLVVSACSDSTGPKNANVSGAWSYSVSNLSGGGLSCNASGTTVTLNQTGTTFTGTYNGGTLSCGSVGTVSVGTGAVASGVVAANSVNFNFDTQDWMNAGSLSGNTIAGTATVRLVLTGGQTVVMNGNFSMVRQ